jgi:hypothetical protein
VAHRTRHLFESASSAQTLAEGLAEYFACNPALKRDASLACAEARQFFRSHDAVHVVYGCSTTMPDEAIVKLVSLFGTTGGVRVLRGYLHHETLDIYRSLPLASTAWALLLAPLLIVRTIWRCSRQRQRWPWEHFEHLLDIPLRDLRAQFGITVAHAETGAS